MHNRLRILVLVTFTLLAGAASPASFGGDVPLTVDQLLAAPASFNGKPVRVDACLFVTRHGMSLFNCTYRRGEENQLVAFEPQDSEQDGAYQALLKAGFASYPDHLVKVTVTGTFHFSDKMRVVKVAAVDHFREVTDAP